MALGDITFYDEGAFGYPGDVEYRVDSSTTLIYAGEPVIKVLGNTTGYVVKPMTDGMPVVGTDSVVGIAATTSTNTATAPGTVKVTKMVSGASMLIAPKTPSSWDTQAEYNALVGARVTIDLTGGSYTLDASDSATYGCVVLPLDVARNPGKVRIAFRQGASYLA
jgi:hypothetical protein